MYWPKRFDQSYSTTKISDTNLKGNSPATGRCKGLFSLRCKRQFSPSEVRDTKFLPDYLLDTFGRYWYLRMPFGISSTPEEFQCWMHTIIDSLPEVVVVIADDILVYGSGTDYMKDHDANLRQFLQRAREQNLKLNRKKLRLWLTEVAYMGHLLTSSGLKPDPMKVQAIRALPVPEDKKAVERFLGFVKYLSRFLPNLAEVVAQLRKLTEKATPFYGSHSSNRHLSKWHLNKLSST